LSKGLCAPVGSLLCGTQEFINHARRIRKQLGGGMRQAGILAAAGIVALEQMVDRLAEDHARARKLAENLAAVPGLCLDVEVPPTNMVFLSLGNGISLTAGQVAERLARVGILVSVVNARRFRLVTHYWIGDDEVAGVAPAFQRALAD
jgi:threonine aldolase